MTDEEKFFAWLDGELGPTDAAEMEAKIAADPALQKLVEEHRGLGSRLREVFEPIAEAPVPGPLAAALRPPADIADFAAAKRSRILPSLPQWTALAASLALGLFLGTIVPQRGEGPVGLKDGKLYAASALNDALDKQLASEPTGPVRIGLTFRNRAGEICRSFTQDASSGLACRAGGRWQVKGLFGAPEGQSGDYRMAAGMDPNLAALVDSAMVGEPLDAAAEKAAKDGGWK